MLSFGVPWLFGAAVAASLVVVGLHLLSVRTPPAFVLPTARFVPEGDARAVARQPRPNDLVLLLLRVLALLCAGAALAGVHWTTSRAALLRVVVADTAVRDSAAWRDSVERSLRRDGAMVDVHFAPGVSRDAGAALVAAVSRTAVLVKRYPALTKVELTVALDSTARAVGGFAAWRSQWPGAVHVTAPAATLTPDSASSAAGLGAVQVRGARERDDVVSAAFISRASGDMLVERADLLGTTDDSMALRVHWPESGVPTGWQARDRVDTVGALVSGGVAIVGPWVRQARLADSLRSILDTSATLRALAWWSDGDVAALEQRSAAGCTRFVAVVVPRGSDLLLSSEARGLMRALTEPCSVARGVAGGVARRLWANEAADAAADPAAPGRAPATKGDSALASAAAFRVTTAAANGSDPWWLTPLLLTASLLLLGVEWAVRRGEAVA